MNIKYLSLVFAALAFESAAMTLSSPDIKEGTPMAKTFEFNGFGCNGANLSPALAWSNPPKGTKSFAITAFDPDAPTPSGFWHWVVVDIPASVNNVTRAMSGKFKWGKEMKNDYGLKGYGGACPPPKEGMHRYQFTLWALPTEKLAIPNGASNAVVGFMLGKTALSKKTLTSTYVID